MLVRLPSAACFVAKKSPIHQIMSTIAQANDEYTIYDDFSQLTEDDFARIDSTIASSSKGLPDIEVQVESTSSDRTHSSTPQYFPSPLQQFRVRHGTKTLSVSDLVSPAWCEVKFDYGLRQKRHKALERRPASFVTEKGKEIFVDKVVAAKSDKITKAGSSVHKKLEREIRPEEILITASTSEERWALRIIDMLDCLESLVTRACAREMPVFGFVKGLVTLGKIDEIVRKRNPVSTVEDKKRALHSSPNTPQKPKRSRRSPSPSQPKITAFLPPANNPELSQTEDQDSLASSSSGSSSNSLDISLYLVGSRSPLRSKPLNFADEHTLYVIDTKTRRSNSLPSNDDTLSSRLQVMLYHRMLTGLLSTSDPFDFHSIWEQLGLKPRASFSKRFISQAQLQSVSCLEDLTTLWHQMISNLHIGSVSPTLQLIYRRQPDSKRKGKRKTGKAAPAQTPAAIIRSREDHDLARAVEASIRDLSALPNEEEQLARVLAQSMVDSEAPDRMKNIVETALSGGDAVTSFEDPEMLWAIQQSLLTHLNDLEATDTQAHTPTGDKSTSEESDDESNLPKVIGIKEFTFDGKFLDDYLDDIMEWWHGERKPRGVSIEQSGRCFTCEYCVGCEWREERAQELADARQKRRSGST